MFFEIESVVAVGFYLGLEKKSFDIFAWLLVCGPIPPCSSTRCTIGLLCFCVGTGVQIMIFVRYVSGLLIYLLTSNYLLLLPFTLYF